MVLLSENRARTAGGAVYQSFVVEGQGWSNVNFVANTAQIGGAVYSLASRTAKEEERSNMFLPTIYAGVLFKNNSATAGGGAVESAAGRDVFRDTRFEGNTATLGGALRLAGTADLISCDFVRNCASEAGPDVANAGHVESVVNTSFPESALLCSRGTFFGYIKASGKDCFSRCTLFLLKTMNTKNGI